MEMLPIRMTFFQHFKTHTLPDSLMQTQVVTSWIYAFNQGNLLWFFCRLKLLRSWWRMLKSNSKTLWFWLPIMPKCLKSKMGWRKRKWIKFLLPQSPKAKVTDPLLRVKSSRYNENRVKLLVPKKSSMFELVPAWNHHFLPRCVIV